MSRPISKGTALITGGAKRIGAGICTFLANYGYNIALNYHHSRKDAKALAHEIISQGGSCKLYPCDLNNVKETDRLIQKVRKDFPDLNLLINNASIFEKSDLRSADPSMLDRHMAIHLKAPLILTKNFANICKRGHIINILDSNIVRNKSKYLIYLLSKKSLHELTQLAAVELAPDIRVNAIAPGYVLPPVSNQLKYKKSTRKIPLRKKGEIGDITQSIRFLIENTYITGQIIFNDGGEHLL